MKKCPKCKKTFSDGVKICPFDRISTVEGTDTDPARSPGSDKKLSSSTKPSPSVLPTTVTTGTESAFSKNKIGPILLIFASASLATALFVHFVEMEGGAQFSLILFLLMFSKAYITIAKLSEAEGKQLYKQVIGGFAIISLFKVAGK